MISKHIIKQAAQQYPKKHLMMAGAFTIIFACTLAVIPNKNAEANHPSEQPAYTAPASSPFDTEIAAQPVTDQPAPSTTMPVKVRVKIKAPKSAATEPLVTKEKTPQDTPATLASAATAKPEIAKTTWQAIKVKRGDTLTHIFKRAGLSTQHVYEFLKTGKEARALSNLHPGEILQFDIQDNQLNQLKRRINNIKSTLFSWNVASKKYEVEHFAKKLTVYQRYKQGKITSSLFASAKEANLSQNIIMELANIFAWDIDFALDIRKGDSFNLIYEERYLDGTKVDDGNILAAQFVNKGETYTAIRYTRKNGNTEYFSPDGRSMRKAFLRTPVDFARISSHFNLRRRHPILHTLRAHKGTDYAARRGTPIKATGNGKIQWLGRKGGYGKTIIIRHTGRYKTVYAHMHRYAKDMRRGKAVKQGQIIGYVGSTGLATGPHLHYEFHENGRVRNPVTVKLPDAQPIARQERQAFLAHVEKTQAQISKLAAKQRNSENTLASAK